jgi:hypothetical protein
MHTHNRHRLPSVVVPSADHVVPAALRPPQHRLCGTRRDRPDAAPNTASVHGPRRWPPPIAPPPHLPQRAKSDRGHLLSRPVPPHHHRGPRERSSRASPPPSGERPAPATSPCRRVPSPPVAPPPPLPWRARSGHSPILSQSMPPHHGHGLEERPTCASPPPPGERSTLAAGPNTVSLAVPSSRPCSGELPELCQFLVAEHAVRKFC